MARVDPGDDTVLRHVVRHYRYDPARRERRHVICAAFDDAAQFEAFLQAEQTALRARIAAGSADPREYLSGVVWPTGERAHARAARAELRAVRHGVRLPPPGPGTGTPAPAAALQALLRDHDHPDQG